MTHRTALLFTTMIKSWCLVGFLCLGIAAWFIESRWGIIPLFAWLFVTCLFGIMAQTPQGFSCLQASTF